jgi:hypothetical protein
MPLIDDRPLIRLVLFAENGEYFAIIRRQPFEMTEVLLKLQLQKLSQPRNRINR